MRKKSKKKIVSLVMALFVGLFVGIVTIPWIKDHLSPSNPIPAEEMVTSPSNPAPTSADLLDEQNWKTYQNKDYGISFKYPGNFETNVFNEPFQDIDLYVGVDFGRIKMPERTLYEEDFKQLGYVISIMIDRTHTIKERAAEAEIYKARKGYKKESITIKGSKGFKYEGVGIDSLQTRIMVERNKQVYMFTISRYVQSGELFDEGNTIFDKMVKSISF